MVVPHGHFPGTQSLTIYGSDSEKDPGWEPAAFTPIGSITASATEEPFTAASLRATKGRSLGEYRWIVWRVAPVSTLGGGENTAFQEFGVETVGEDPAPDPPDGAMSNPFPATKGSFKGFDSYQFKLDGIPVEVICPKTPARGKPWLWRSMFWKAISRVHMADLELVKEGYHVVLVYGDVSGHPRGNANIDTAYDFLTAEHGFSQKCSMSSMSRGTLSLFRWASANPDKVESIYVDNGVCNVKSWPAGKLVPGSGSNASGAPESWKHLKVTYGFTSDTEALAAKISPIDLLEPLAKASVPILTVCGSKDTAVPYEENDGVLEQRYKALGGSIKVIVEDKGHSHGMKDPTPVIEFIRKNTPAPEGKPAGID